jgi:hypothetical protein
LIDYEEKQVLRCIALIASLCSPIIGALHAALYETLKNWLSTNLGIGVFFAGLVASVIISVVGIFTVCLLGWLIWRLWDRRIREKVKAFYLPNIVNLEEPLHLLRDELNREINVCETSKKYKPSRWDTITQIYNLVERVTNLFEADESIEKYLKDNGELAAVRELRNAIRSGLKRTENILTSGARDVHSIYRAEVIVEDVSSHLDRFKVVLVAL